MKDTIELVEKNNTDDLFSNGLLGFYFCEDNFGNILLITKKGIAIYL